jgi:predicted RNase H-like nuclease (RuvC/YqgF family)
MKLAKPEEIEHEEELSPEESERSGGNSPVNRKVTFASTGQEMPVEEAINLNNDLLYGEVNRLEQQVEDLQEENEELRETIEKMESVLNILAAESDTNLVGHCNECGDRAEVESRGFAKSAVVCQNESCQSVMAEIR